MKLSEVVYDTFVLLLASWSVNEARHFVDGIEFTHLVIQRTEPEEYYLYSRDVALALLARSDGG